MARLIPSVSPREAKTRKLARPRTVTSSLRWQAATAATLLLTSLLVDTIGQAVASAAAETIDLTRRQLRRAKVESARNDKARWRVFTQGSPIPKTMAEVEAARQPTESPQTTEVALTEEELQAAAAEADRLSRKRHVSDLVIATIFEGGYSEVEIIRGTSRAKAFVNVDLKEEGPSGPIETDDAVYTPLLLITTENLAEIRARDAAAQDDPSNESAIRPLPPSELMPAAGATPEYVVGYDASVGTPDAAAYETLEAILNAIERARAATSEGGGR